MKYYIWCPTDLPFNSLKLQAVAMSNVMAEHKVQVEILTPSNTGVFRLISILRHKENVVIWHFGAFDSMLFISFFMKNIIVVYHNITPARFFWRTQPLVGLKSIVGRLQLRLLPAHLHYIAVSPFNKEELLSMGKERVDFVPCYVREGSGREGKKSKFPSLFFNGRLAENKGVEDLLGIVYDLSNSFPNKIMLFLKVDGELRGVYRRKYQENIDKLYRQKNVKVIIIKGPLSESQIDRLHQFSWIYVSASRHEGFGLPIFEAINNGTPALYTSCGGTESLLQGCGCVSADQKDFSKQVLAMLTNPYLRQDLLDAQRSIAVQSVGLSLYRTKIFDLLKIV